MKLLLLPLLLVIFSTPFVFAQHQGCPEGSKFVNGECIQNEPELPEETKDDVILALIEENNRVIAENAELKSENHKMSLLITELQTEIENLKAVVLEQIRVIMTHFN